MAEDAAEVAEREEDRPRASPAAEAVLLAPVREGARDDRVASRVADARLVRDPVDAAVPRARVAIRELGEAGLHSRGEVVLRELPVGRHEAVDQEPFLVPEVGLHEDEPTRRSSRCNAAIQPCGGFTAEFLSEGRGKDFRAHTCHVHRQGGDKPRPYVPCTEAALRGRPGPTLLSGLARTPVAVAREAGPERFLARLGDEDRLLSRARADEVSLPPRIDVVAVDRLARRRGSESVLDPGDLLGPRQRVAEDLEDVRVAEAAPVDLSPDGQPRGSDPESSLRARRTVLQHVAGAGKGVEPVSPREHGAQLLVPLEVAKLARTPEPEDGEGLVVLGPGIARLEASQELDLVLRRDARSLEEAELVDRARREQPDGLGPERQVDVEGQRAPFGARGAPLDGV